MVSLAAQPSSAIISLLAFYLLRHLRFSAAIGWTVFSAAAISTHFLARPHIFSYVLLTIWTVKLIDAYDRDDFSLRSLLVFAPIMALWANLHGSFTFALALLYVFAGVCFLHNAFRRDYAKCRTIFVVVSVVTLAALITPYGIWSALATRELLNLKYTIPQIIELRPPDFQTDHIGLALFLATFLVVAGLGVRLRGARLIAFGMVAFVGLTYVRGLVMFFLLAPIILARPVSARARYLAPEISETEGENEAEPDRVLGFLRRRLSAVTAACATIAVALTLAMWGLRDVAPPASIAPRDAVAFVHKANITGRVFNDYDFGGFLVFSGIPTFVDGRALPFGDGFLHTYFDTADLVDADAAFKVLDDFKIDWIILKPAQPLARAVTRSAKWDKVYADQFAVVFVRHRS